MLEKYKNTFDLQKVLYCLIYFDVVLDPSYRCFWFSIAGFVQIHEPSIVGKCLRNAAIEQNYPAQVSKLRSLSKVLM